MISINAEKAFEKIQYSTNERSKTSNEIKKTITLKNMNKNT